MKLNFKKISAVMASSFLMVSSVGFAAAVGFPTPFVDGTNNDFAVVYGSSSLDNVPANTVANYFKTLYDTENPVDNDNDVTVTYESSDGVSDNEIELGGSIVGGDIKSKLTDNKIPNLFDGKVSWDDGVTDEDYNTHEEITISDLNILTTLDDDELSEEVALSNDKGLEYRYVFEEAIEEDKLDDNDADDFVINFLGEDITITEMEDNEVTLTKGSLHSLKRGDSKTIEGKTITLEGVYTDKVRVSVNGESRTAREDETMRFGGFEVRVDEVYASSYADGYFEADFTIGDDIETSVSDGDAYFGEDEDDPKWVWSIQSPGAEDGWIGVKYNEREKDEDDNLVYIGDSYTFPKNFAQVFFERTTDVDYEDFDLSFDDSMDLYDAEEKSLVLHDDVKVVMIKGDTDESFLVGDKETDSIYLYKDGNSIEVYYKDVNKDVSDGAKVRFTDSIYDFVEEFEDVTYTNSTDNSTYIVSESIGFSTYDIATLVSDDTEFTLSMNMDNENAIISIDDIKISIGGNNAFEYLGSEEEDAQGDDILVGDKSIGTREDDVMTHYGVIVKSPESNADADEVILSIPSEQVFAKVSVLGSDAVITENTNSNSSESDLGGDLGLNIGSLIVKDSEISSVSSKNQIIVGGSCVNAEAARLLGVPLGTCGDAFKLATGVGPGQYLLKTFASETNTDKVVVLVAGYHAADTVRGVNELLASNVSN